MRGALSEHFGFREGVVPDHDFVKNTVEMKGIGRPIYASITGDEVAITNIRVLKQA